MKGINLLKCICDETRFDILVLLQRHGELCVSDFVGRLGKDQPLVSHHLRILRQCGIVRSRGDGKRTMYKVSSGELSRLISGIARAGERIPALCSGKSCC